MQSKKREKTLTELADEMLKKVEQADNLKDLAERNPEEASRVSTIVDAFMNPGSNISEKSKIYSKIDIVTSLIEKNIVIAKRLNTKNFDWSEYQQDNNHAFNIKTKISSTNIIDNSDLKYLNVLFKKHSRLNNTFNNI